MEESEKVEELVQKAVLSGDPNIIFGYIRSLGIQARIYGYGAAKALWHSWKSWPLFQSQGISEEWENLAPVMSGLSLDQCRTYRDFFEAVHMNPDVPEYVKPYVAQKPIQAQLLLTAAARDGDLSDDDWEKVMNAETPAEIQEIVRGQRGPRTSSETRLIIVEDRDGTVKGKEGTSGKYVIAAKLLSSREDLEGDDEYEHRVRSKVIARIRKAIGVQL
jgi:hypothetical protein